MVALLEQHQQYMRRGTTSSVPGPQILRLLCFAIRSQRPPIAIKGILETKTVKWEDNSTVKALFHNETTVNNSPLLDFYSPKGPGYYVRH